MPLRFRLNHELPISYDYIAEPWNLMQDSLLFFGGVETHLIYYCIYLFIILFYLFIYLFIYLFYYLQAFLQPGVNSAY
jgi:hypothetical protein